MEIKYPCWHSIAKQRGSAKRQWNVELCKDLYPLLSPNHIHSFSYTLSEQNLFHLSFCIATDTRQSICSAYDASALKRTIFAEAAKRSTVPECIQVVLFCKRWFTLLKCTSSFILCLVCCNDACVIKRIQIERIFNVERLLIIQSNGDVSCAH